ncbi:MAG: 1,4-beta-xylanase, partial [Acutalibacteraceae bacterium]
LIDEDHREKPAYKAINRLINNEWRTNVTLTTDGDGKVRFNGFNGEYEAVISGKKQLIHLSSENGELSAVLKE